MFALCSVGESGNAKIESNQTIQKRNKPHGMKSRRQQVNYLKNEKKKAPGKSTFCTVNQKIYISLSDHNQKLVISQASFIYAP